MSGTGPLVLLLHAGVADRRMWAPQVSGLAAGYRVLRVDLRGFGDSPLPSQPYDHVDDVVAVLTSMHGGQQVAVVGASFGGLVAQEFARRHPDLVRQLVLLCPASALLEPDEQLKALWLAEERLVAAGDLDAATSLNVDTWCGPDATTPTRELVAVMQRRAFALQAERPDLQVRADPGDPGEVDIPTLVLTGDHDLAAFRCSAEALAARMPRASLERLPWAGHLPNLERPAETTAIILHALRARSRSATPCAGLDGPGPTRPREADLGPAGAEGPGPGAAGTGTEVPRW